MPRRNPLNALTDTEVRSLHRAALKGELPKDRRCVPDGGNLYFEMGRYWRYRYERTVGGGRRGTVLGLGV